MSVTWLFSPKFKSLLSTLSKYVPSHITSSVFDFYKWNNTVGFHRQYGKWTNKNKVPFPLFSASSRILGQKILSQKNRAVWRSENNVQRSIGAFLIFYSKFTKNEKRNFLHVLTDGLCLICTSQFVHVTNNSPTTPSPLINQTTTGVSTHWKIENIYLISASILNLNIYVLNLISDWRCLFINLFLCIETIRPSLNHWVNWAFHIYLKILSPVMDSGANSFLYPCILVITKRALLSFKGVLFSNVSGPAIVVHLI